VACGVESHRHILDADLFTQLRSLGRTGVVCTIADCHDVERLWCCQHMAMTGTGVIRMAMGDQRPVDAAHRIDEEIAGRAVKPFGAGNEQHFGTHRHVLKLGRSSRERKGLRLADETAAVRLN
jgi:hypothetical protein